MATPPVTSVASGPTTRSRSRRAKKDSHKSRRSSDSKSKSSCLPSELPTANDIGGRSRSPIKSPGSHKNVKCSSLDKSCSAIPNHSTSANCLPVSVNSSAPNCTSNSTIASMPTQHPSESVQNNCIKEENRPPGICIRNLPVLVTDTSLRDELFHEYKKHGKVRMVKIISQGTERYAVVCFKKTEDVQKALEASKDKSLYGCKLEVTLHEGLIAIDNGSRPVKIEMDEFHPKATRTLFIGNLEKDITAAELRKHFDQFGEIIEIDIKKQDFTSSYAFIQYSDIVSVVKAISKLNGKNLGANPIKLTFGKSIPTNCVWINGVVKGISNKFLARHFNRFGCVVYATVDQEKGHALIFYESVDTAQMAVSKMRGRFFLGRKLQNHLGSENSIAQQVKPIATGTHKLPFPLLGYPVTKFVYLLILQAESAR